MEKLSTVTYKIHFFFCSLSGFIYVLAMNCDITNYHKLIILKHIYYLSFCEAGGQEWLSWVLCLKVSQKSTIKASARVKVSHEGTMEKALLQTPSRWQSSVP